MPSVSEKQRRVMAIAEHHPEKLHSRNKALLKMSHKQLHEFASKVTPGNAARRQVLLKRKHKGH